MLIVRVKVARRRYACATNSKGIGHQIGERPTKNKGGGGDGSNQKGERKGNMRLNATFRRETQLQFDSGGGYEG